MMLPRFLLIAGVVTGLAGALPLRFVLDARLHASPAALPSPQGLPPADLQLEAQRTMERMLEAFDPDLLQQAAAKGVYKRDDYPVLRTMNPFFLRGDFNGDGALDVAVWVTKRNTTLTGVAIIHSTLDAVHYIGAGTTDADISGSRKPGLLAADTWHVLPKGTVVRAFESVPATGAVRGRPFTLQHEALEFVWLGKSSFTFYWANGEYRELWTGD